MIERHISDVWSLSTTNHRKTNATKLPVKIPFREYKTTMNNEQGQELVVSDLLIAAEYATAIPQPLVEKEPNDEIEIDEEEDASTEPTSDLLEADSKEQSESEKSINDDNDDESDVDLAEALQKMHQDDEEEPNRPLMTTNEIDVYHTPLSNLRLDVKESAPPIGRLEAAGQIEHVLLEERTLVVKSLPNMILSEESLLVIQIPGQGIVPLGKILEVFGPVSAPLYSLRLADPTDDNDPWAPQGEYARQLKPRLTTYVYKDAAQILDPNTVPSGRGCDASNFHDEEDTPDYSDDEQERQANRRVGKRRSNGTHVNNRPGGFFAPAGFPAAPSYRTSGVATASGSNLPAPPSNLSAPAGDTIYYD